MVVVGCGWKDGDGRMEYVSVIGDGGGRVMVSVSLWDVKGWSG